MALRRFDGSLPDRTRVAATVARDHDRIANDKSLGIWIEFDPGSQVPCPSCRAASKAYDTKQTKWRHLDFLQYKTYAPNMLMSGRNLKVQNGT